MKEVYVDANIFITAATGDPRSLAFLESVKAGMLHACTSVLTIDEVSWIIKKLSGREAAAEAGESILTFPNFETIDATKTILSEALHIFRTEKLAPRDSIHLATMRTKHLNTIATFDADFDNLPGIKRLTL